MSKKTLFCALAVILVLFCGSLAMGADKKLGYGFEPGLVAGKDFVAGQLIVGLNEGMSADGVKQAVAAAGVPVVKEIEGAILLQFASEEAAVAAVSALASRPEVAFVERNGFMSIPPQPVLVNEKCGTCNRAAQKGLGALSVSTDPGTGYQYHLTVIRKTAALPALSAIPPTVAVIDTGVDYTHPDLSGKVYLGKNCIDNTFDPMDDHGHGTHCAGLIAAKAGNNDDGEGVCPNCKILAVKALTHEGWGNFFDIADAMQYVITVRNATSPVTKVVSMSIGGPASALISAKVDLIKAAGMVLAAAAGNSNSVVPSYPGAYPNTALRVMATEQTNCRTWFSNFSPSTAPSQYNIAAPGWDILSTTSRAGFVSMSGTSMATPIVAGGAALVWGQLTTLTRDTLVTRLLTYGQPISCGFKVATRRLDVRKAILGTSETAVIGHVFDAFSGTPASPPTTPVTVQLKLGAVIHGTDNTNTGGSYEMPGGAAGAGKALYGTKAGYITTLMRYPITITANLVHGPYWDAIVKSRASKNASLVIDWKNSQPVNKVTGQCEGACLGWDFDLFVKAPSGGYYYWGNPGDLLTTPYIFFARDSANDLVPMETTIIGSPAATGIHKVFVDRYPYSGSHNQTYAGSKIQFQVFNGAAAVARYDTCPCTTQRYWYIGDLTKTATGYTWANKNLCQAVAP